jgi:hypothetical protein
MEEHQWQSDKTNRSLNAAQLRKMRLECEHLRRQKKWGIVAIFIPVITTAVAVAGLLISLWQIQRAQKKEREDRYLNETLTRQEQENERTNKIKAKSELIKNRYLSLLPTIKSLQLEQLFL